MSEVTSNNGVKTNPAGYLQVGISGSKQITVELMQEWIDECTHRLPEPEDYNTCCPFTHANELADRINEFFGVK